MSKRGSGLQINFDSDALVNIEESVGLIANETVGLTSDIREQIAALGSSALRISDRVEFLITNVTAEVNRTVSSAADLLSTSRFLIPAAVIFLALYVVIYALKESGLTCPCCKPKDEIKKMRDIEASESLLQSGK